MLLVEGKNYMNLAKLKVGQGTLWNESSEEKVLITPSLPQKYQLLLNPELLSLS